MKKADDAYEPPSRMGMYPVTTYVDEEFRRRLRRTKADTDQPIQDILRQAADEYMKRLGY